MDIIIQAHIFCNLLEKQTDIDIHSDTHSNGQKNRRTDKQRERDRRTHVNIDRKTGRDRQTYR